MSDDWAASLFFLCFGLFWLVVGVRIVLNRQAVSRSKVGLMDTHNGWRDMSASTS